MESDPLTVDLDRIAVDDRGTADNVGTGGCCRCKDYGSGEQPDREAHGSWSFSAFDRVDEGQALFLRQVRRSMCSFATNAGWMTRLRRAPKRRTPTCSTIMSSASMLAANSCERARSGVRNGWAARTAVVARLTGTSAAQLGSLAAVRQPASLSGTVSSASGCGAIPREHDACLDMRSRPA